MSGPEQAWMFTMAGQDVKEEYEEKLAFVEYLASFINPEAVKQITEERKKAKPMSDEQFNRMLEREHGRKPQFRAKPV